MPQTHYEVLGVPITATLKDIRKAYQVLARRWHPDLSAHLADDTQRNVANERFKLITAAYNTLNNPEQRRKYDATLQPSRPARDTFFAAPSTTYFDFSSPNDYFKTGPNTDHFSDNLYASPRTSKEQEEALLQAQARVEAQSRASREYVDRLMRESDERVAKLIREADEQVAQLIREADEQVARIIAEANVRQRGFRNFRDL